MGHVVGRPLVAWIVVLPARRGNAWLWNQTRHLVADLPWRLNCGSAAGLLAWVALDGRVGTDAMAPRASDAARDRHLARQLPPATDATRSPSTCVRSSASFVHLAVGHSPAGEEDARDGDGA